MPARVLPSPDAPTGDGASLIGESPALRELRRTLGRAAATDVPVLLLGETGTGKSLLARLIHARGARRQGPFIAINCAALPDALVEAELFGFRRGAFTGAHEDREGLLASAHRGTVLLDEVGDLPLAQQAKLLTVLEDGEVRPVGARRATAVDVRVVSATSSPLEHRVREKAFRIDLFHRLALLTVRVPPLRERSDDLRLLAAHFLHAAARRYRVPAPRLDPEALRVLAAHAWPGNVRELAHALEAALILGGEGGLAEALRAVIGGGGPVARSESASTDCTGTGESASVGSEAALRYSFYGSDAEERQRIRTALDRCRGNRTRAAHELGMSRNTLRDRMRRYDL
jgi:DNA-binding NtrC family response regulator